jgi:hypothetical protein
MFSIITASISVLSFIGLIYFTYKMIKRFKDTSSVMWRIQVGYLCYLCKQPTKDIEDISYDEANSDDKYCLCKVCKRDVDIDSLTGNIKNRFLNKIKFLLLKDFVKFSIIHFSIVVILIGVGLTFNIRFLSTVVNVMNGVYAYVNYKRAVMMTEKEDCGK